MGFRLFHVLETGCSGFQTVSCVRNRVVVGFRLFHAVANVVSFFLKRKSLFGLV